MVRTPQGRLLPRHQPQQGKVSLDLRTGGQKIVRPGHEVTSYSRTTRSAASGNRPRLQSRSPKLNPRLIYCSITRLRPERPVGRPPGYDFIIQGIGIDERHWRSRRPPGGGPQKVGWRWSTS